jgi:hypothetical protein
MILPALHTDDEPTASAESNVLEDELNQRARVSQLASGQQVRVRVGPLVGLRGVTDDRAHDGRWVVRLLGFEPGVYLCIDSSLIVNE